jgi:predicted MFS family arabinose efflux permease
MRRVVSERWLLLTLAAIQFTAVVDFLIIMPLGPQYMRLFKIDPGQFGLMVSAYALSAGLAGIAAGLILDQFDRKAALLFVYAGFTVGTLFCAVAPNYLLLVGARVMAGAFGGVTGALILTIVGDVIPEERRGRAMGLVMSSFSVASICGVPLGLVLASHLNWHVPFFGLAGLSAVVLVGASSALPPLKEHLQHAQEHPPVERLLAVLSHADHQMAFLFMAVLTSTGFVIFPYLSTYMVANAGLTEKQLPLIYLFGGACTIFSMNWIGRWADYAGKVRVFTWMSFIAILPLVTLTNLPKVSLATAISTSTVFMICMSGRMVPAMALLTASIEPRYRGGFLSLNSSVQQFASGLAAYASGLIMGQTATGEITHFPVIGLIAVACAVLCVYLARFLRRPQEEAAVRQSLVLET